MSVGAIILAGVIAIAAFSAWRRFGTAHGEGMFVARASGALFELGLDVKRLPPAARDKFFREGHAIYEATKNRTRSDSYNPKFFAMRFFGWYGVESNLTDTAPFLREGVLAGSIPIMRKWAVREPLLLDSAEHEIRLIFDHLYEGFEALNAPTEAILQAQLHLLELMREGAPER